VCTKQEQKREQGIQLYLFRTHLLITISVMVSGRLGAMSRIEVFSSSMNCMSLDSISEVFYRLYKMLIATKHIADNNFVFQYNTVQWHILCAT